MTVSRGPPGRPAASSGCLGCWRRRPPLGFGAKVSIAIALGLSFAIVWTSLSPTSSSQQISTERSSFAADIVDPPPAPHNHTATTTSGGGGGHGKPRPTSSRSHKKRHSPAGSHRPNATASPDSTPAKSDHAVPSKPAEPEPEPGTELEEEEQEQEKEAELPMPEDSGDGKAPEEESEKAPELELDELSEGDGYGEEAEDGQKKAPKKTKKQPPLFSSSAHYHWKHCGAKSGHHYIPCVDFDGDGSQRHRERSCPRSPATCLVSMPKEYKPPAPWPERKEKVWYGNVGHPRLSLVRTHAPISARPLPLRAPTASPIRPPNLAGIHRAPHGFASLSRGSSGAGREEGGCSGPGDAGSGWGDSSEEDRQVTVALVVVRVVAAAAVDLGV